METKLQDKKQIDNSKLFKEVVNELYIIVKRRTSTSYSIMIINDILKNLRGRFDFLKSVKVMSNGYAEAEDEFIIINDNLNSVDPKKVGRSIESIIRLVCMNMKNRDAGLYFVTELKERIGDKYVSKLKDLDVDIDLIQHEQHYLYKQGKMKVSLPDSYDKINLKGNKHKSIASLLNIVWEKVAFWEYKENICTLYDKKGKVIDRLPLDAIVKDYILELTGFDELPLNSDKIVELNEKEYEFIQLLYSRDLNAEEAMELLNVSHKDLSIIIRKLLVYEILQYISYDVVMLTENGVKKLTEKH